MDYLNVYSFFPLKIESICISISSFIITFIIIKYLIAFYFVWKTKLELFK